MSDNDIAQHKAWQIDIERRVVSLETDRAVGDERYSNLSRRLDKIDTGLSRLLWLVIAAVVTAFIGFLLRGGLNVG